MSNQGRGPPAAVSETWSELREDAAATAEEYGENGWRTLLVDTGDVTPLTGEPFGLDVLVPEDVFEALEELVEEVTFDTSHVYRTEAGDVRFFIVVVEAREAGSVVVVPAYLHLSEADDLESKASKAGAMYTHVRPQSNDLRVTFTHDDPDLFF